MGQKFEVLLVTLNLVLRTSAPLTEVSWALRARNAKKVSEMSPRASGPGTRKGRAGSQT